ncbi:MAG: anti-sigma factor domain-containing protein [Candidatus Binataceae bacterium]
MTHEELKALLPIYALDRLEGEEARALAEHLAAGCDECQRELASFREALAALAMTSVGEDHGHPDRVWELLSQRLDDGDAPGAAPLDLGLRADRRAAADPDSIDLRFRRMRRAAAFFGAAAAVLILALGYSNFELGAHLESTRAATAVEIAAMHDRIDALQHGVEAASDRIAALKSRLDSNTTLTLAAFSPDTTIVHLAGMPASSKAAAMVALSPSNHTALMRVAGLPEAPADKVYEVWWIGKKSGPMRAGTFRPAARGTSSVELAMPPEGELILASAVTLEPAGGANKPTGSMYLKGDFPH